MSTNALILGANGSIARVAIDLFRQEAEARLTLYLCDARRLTRPALPRVKVVEGDVLDTRKLAEVMRGQDVVYANLAGDLAPMARSVVAAMHETGVRRLIWISSMGIYGEVPAEKYRGILDPYRDSAKIIEESDLDYTILRPGWFTNGSESDYTITRKGEPFRGHDISRRALASLIVKLATTAGLEVRESLGVSNQ